MSAIQRTIHRKSQPLLKKKEFLFLDPIPSPDQPHQENPPPIPPHKGRLPSHKRRTPPHKSLQNTNPAGGQSQSWQKQASHSWIASIFPGSIRTTTVLSPALPVLFFSVAIPFFGWPQQQVFDQGSFIF